VETQLELNVRAKNPLIWLHSVEEDRSVPRVQAVAEKLGYVVFEWDCIHGFAQRTAGQFRQPGDGRCTNVDQALAAVGEYKHQRTLFIFRDFHPLTRRMDQAVDYVLLARRVKDLYRTLRQNGNAVVFLASSPATPAELEECLALVEAALPDKDERLAIVTAWIAANARGLPCDLDEAGIHRLISTTAGMTSRQIQSALAMSVVNRKGLTAQAVDDVLAEKVKAVKASEVLECVPLKETLDDVGGLAGLKEWLRKRELSFGPAAVRYGLPMPKGILVLGPPGVGKSLTAKAAANVLHMALLRLDTGKIQASLVGQSEERMRRALALAEVQAPCVLWVDEIEKAFAGVRGPSGDSGVTQRVFGSFLTWMQERNKPVFIFATANNISDLPPEFLRKGRFDEILFVDLPTPEERKAILEVLLRKYGQKHARLITDALVKRLDRYTGAEIESVIIEAMYEAFYDNQRPLTAGDLEAATTRILPLADQMRDEIEALRRWGKANARPAS
jgi:SpoVK/Ycf46/Vps4 family AAA+-type ATPase